MKIQRSRWIAGGSGLIALLFSFVYFRAKEARFDRLEAPVSVVVAKSDILQGSRLDTSQLELIQVPRRFVQPGVATELEQITGAVTLTPILKNEQILETKLVPVGEKSGLAVKIPQGLRALSVEVDDVSGVAGLIRPNNFVDVLATFEMEDSTDNAQVTTHTLAQRVLVLAVASDVGSGFDEEKRSNLGQTKNMLGGSAIADSLTSRRKRTLTLALDPKQAQEIEFAKQEGILSFALRPQWEEEPLDLQPTAAIDVVGFKGHARKTGYREYRGK